ncbi:MAG: translation initiation factor IF-1 [Candidatus Yanofskybacteria bacterium]|nr:translation initiation factor IF-1 [Candidatus Yanofskybacteria bacterium]
MSNSDKQKIDGQVIEALPNTTFKVVLNDGREILAYLSGKMRLHHIKVMLGDRVAIELSPDGNKGRIVRRL